MAAGPASDSVSLEDVHHHHGQGRLINVHDPPRLRRRSGFGMIRPKVSMVMAAGSGAAAHAGVEAVEEREFVGAR